MPLPDNHDKKWTLVLGGLGSYDALEAPLAGTLLLLAPCYEAWRARGFGLTFVTDDAWWQHTPLWQTLPVRFPGAQRVILPAEKLSGAAADRAMVMGSFARDVLIGNGRGWLHWAHMPLPWLAVRDALHGRRACFLPQRWASLPQTQPQPKAEASQALVEALLPEAPRRTPPPAVAAGRWPKKPLRVALVCQSPHVGGSERALLNLAIGLQTHRPDAIIPVFFLPDVEQTGSFAPHVAQAARETGLCVASVPPLPWYLWASRDVARYQERLQRSIAQCTQDLIAHRIAGVFINTLTHVPMAMAAQGLGLPYVVWVKGILDPQNIPDPDTTLKLAHDRWLLAHAARVLTASQWTRRFYRRWVPEEKLQTIPNWTPVPCRLPERCPSQPPVFVSLSAWQKHKGLADLITATAMLHQQRPEAAFQVHLYGLGREGQHLRRLVAQLGVQHRVCFMGRTDNPPAVYQAATALVLPSHIEAFGMVLIEAMAAACPVIASRVGGPAEIVTHGQEGLLFNVGDATGLAACMAQILDDAAGAARLGVAGYHTARQRYNGDATLREMTALWMEL